jgi:hypothetical protein
VAITAGGIATMVKLGGRLHPCRQVAGKRYL